MDHPKVTTHLLDRPMAAPPDAALALRIARVIAGHHNAVRLHAGAPTDNTYPEEIGNCHRQP